MGTNTLVSELLAPRIEVSVALPGERRLEIQGRVEGLRPVGGLPALPSGGLGSSVAHGSSCSKG